MDCGGIQINFKYLIIIILYTGGSGVHRQVVLKNCERRTPSKVNIYGWNIPQTGLNKKTSKKVDFNDSLHTYINTYTLIIRVYIYICNNNNNYNLIYGLKIIYNLRLMLYASVDCSERANRYNNDGMVGEEEKRLTFEFRFRCVFTQLI